MDNFYKQIQQSKYPYVISELGSNHNGDMELAKKMIIESKNAGADCVKFQSWTKETIFAKKKYSENYFLNDDYRSRDDFNLEKIVEKFSISENELIKMKKLSDELGIDCTSTPFSKREVDFLVEEMKVRFIKVASMDLNNYPFLEYIAKKNLPVVISTGLGDFYEIDKAVKIIEETGNNQIIILHCVSLYPPKDTQVNLNNIDTLKKNYPYPIGFSDHTLGYSIPIASAVKGVRIIEKHFTLDKEMFGWDHKASATADELKIICKESKRIVDALGSNRIICVEDEERKNEFRRSIVTTRNIEKGEKIALTDLDFKRPGTGIKPDEVKYVVGRTLAKDIEEDSILKWEDLI